MPFSTPPFAPISLRPARGLLTLWRLYCVGIALLSAVVLLFPFSLSVSLGGGTIANSAFPAVAVHFSRLPLTPARLFFAGLWLLFLACVYAFYLPRLFRRQVYSLSPQSAEVRGGLLFPYQRVFPLQGLQYFARVSHPLQRWLGISTLILVAAGGKIVMSGIDNTKSIEIAALLSHPPNGISDA